MPRLRPLRSRRRPPACACVRHWEAEAQRGRGPSTERFAAYVPATLERLGADRLEWLRSLPPRLDLEDLAVVHASPDDLWRAPAPDAADDELAETYEPLRARVACYGHIHRPYVRRVDAA